LYKCIAHHKKKMNIDVNLKFDPLEIKRIYDNLFLDEKHKFKKHIHRRVFTIIGMIILIAVLIIVARDLKWINLSFILFGLLIYNLINLVAAKIRFTKIINRKKKEVNKWISEKSKVSEYRIVANDERITLYEDKHPSEFVWAEITNVIIDKDFLMVYFQSDKNIILPKYGFSETDFQQVEEIIQKKMLKNAL